MSLSIKPKKTNTVEHAKLLTALHFVNETIPVDDIAYTHRVKKSGVYVVTDSNYNVLYIGEAVNIYQRITKKSHPLQKKMPDFRFDDLNFFCLLYTNKDDRTRAETILVGALNPVYNSVKVLHGKVKKFR